MARTLVRDTSRRLPGVIPTLVLVLGFGVVANVGATTRATAGPEESDVPDVVVASGDGVNKPFFPSVSRLDDGRLVTVFYWATEHSPAIVGGESGQIMWTESTDNGQTWSEPRVVIDTQYDDRDGSITQLRDGTILLSWFQTDWTGYPVTPATIRGTFVIRSTDGGQTWSQPVPVESQMSCGCGPPDGSYFQGWNATSSNIVELDNGDLLVGLHGTAPAPPGEGNAASVVRSTDGGRTWPIENEVMIPRVEGIIPSEIAIAQLPDGTITSAIRSARDRFERSYVAESTDDGHTWSPPIKTVFSGQDPDLLRLPNKDLLLTYGSTAAGKWGSFEAIVGRLLRPKQKQFWNDSEQTWADTEPVLIYGGGQGIDQGAPSTAALDADHLFTVSYDAGKEIIVGSYSETQDYEAANGPPKPMTPDVSDHSHHGVVYGSPALVDGVFGTAVEFSAGDHVEVRRADTLAVGAEAFTVSAWFRTSEQAPQAILWAYDQTPHPRVPVHSVWIRMDPSRPRLLGVLTNGKGDTAAVSINRSFADGQWHHVAITRNESAITLYVDGSSADTTGPLNGSVSDNAFAGVHVGQRLDGGDPLTGSVDEIVLLDRSLTADQVNTLAQKNVIPSDAELLHLPLDQIRRGSLPDD